VHNVGNLRHLGQPLEEPKACWKQRVLRRRRKVCVEEESQMLEGSELQTVGAATLKPREAEVVWTRGADNRLVLAGCRERVGVSMVSVSVSGV